MLAWHSSLPILSYWHSTVSQKQKCCLPSMVWIVWQLPKKTTEEKRWAFIEYLLCCQTLCNSFSAHEVTSDMTKSRGPNNEVRTLIVSMSLIFFSLLDCFHTCSLHTVARWPPAAPPSLPLSWARPWLKDCSFPCLYSNPKENSDWPYSVMSSWLNQSPTTGLGRPVQESVV